MLLRSAVNTVTLATVAGRLLAARHGVALRPGPHGLLLALDYPRAFPARHNPAVCIGDVVLCRLGEADLAARPRLLDHEARHAAQWALLLGPVGFLPAYAAGSAWSWLRTGNPGVANPLEVLAGLSAGGYRPERAPGPPLRRWAQRVRGAVRDRLRWRGSGSPPRG